MLSLSTPAESARRLTGLALILSIWTSCLCPLGIAATPIRASTSSLKSVKSQDAVTPDQPPVAAELRNSTTPPPTNDEARQDRLSESYGKLPLSFEANQGQAAPNFKFLTRANGYTMFLSEQGSEMVLSNPVSGKAWGGKSRSHQNGPATESVLKTRFIGRSSTPTVKGLDELDGSINYFVGKDRSKWQTGVHSYGRVKYEKVYPGIDVVYYGDRGTLEYDFIVSPGADPRAIKLGFDGAKSLQKDKNGDLVFKMATGEVRQQRPIAYQEVAGERRTVESRYEVLGNRQVVIKLGAYDSSKPLFIDPALSYSTYLGGSGDDQAAAIAIDGAGYAYITGSTTSTNFPNTYKPYSGLLDAFITKLKPEGNGTVYTTYFGGNDDDAGAGIAVDAFGKAYITGGTLSLNFPTQNPFQNTYGGSGWTDGDAFVVKLNQQGTGIEYSTYLGGTSDDRGAAIAVDGSGNAYVTGYTGSTNFPTASPFQAALAGTANAFVTKLAPAGNSLVYSTYLGGGAEDKAFGIAVSSAGNAYVTGYTSSNNFPTNTPFQSTFGGSYDAFATKLSASGNSLSYSTYLGGTGYDIGRGIVVDSSGYAFVGGNTRSANFPLQNAYDATLDAGPYGYAGDAFVTKLTPAGNALTFSTFIGANGDDSANAIAIDSSGAVYIAGVTDSTDYPLLNPVQSTLRGNADAFITTLNAAGSALTFSTYFGGSIVWVGEQGVDVANGIAVDPSKNIFVAGFTDSSNLTTKNAFQSTYRNGPHDAFVMRVDDSSTAFTLSGSVNDPYNNGVSGVTVTLSGAAAASTTTDAAGNYAFGNLAAGDYTLTPTKTDYTFSPVNQSFTALDGDKSAKFFATSIYNITGHLSDESSANISGASVALSGSQSGSVLSDSSGNYSLNVAPGGNYVVTPSKFTYAFTPINQSFNNVTASQTADFTGTVTSFNVSGHIATTGGSPIPNVTVTVSGSQFSSVQTDASGNYVFENLPAGGNYTITPSSSGYGFSPPSQTFTNLSAAQTANFTGITYTISGQVTIDTNGAPLPGVTVYLLGGQTQTTTTDASGNYSFTVAPGLNYFVNCSAPHYSFAPDFTSFPSLQANQVANFTATLVFKISGIVIGPDGVTMEMVTMNLTGYRTGTMMTNWFVDGGMYHFDVLPAVGNYTVTPSRAGYTFSPSSVTFNPLTSDKTVNFQATPAFSVSGRVTNSGGTGISGVTMSLGGSQTTTVQTNSSGNYTFPSVAEGGNYTLTPSKANFTFTPTNVSFTNLSASQTGVDFQGAGTYTITGRLATNSGTGISGATVSLSGSQMGNVQTDANGNYSFTGITPGGSYWVTPWKTGSSFTPQNRQFTNVNANQTGNFVSGAVGSAILNPTADAHVKDGSSAAVNFGTATTIEVRTSGTPNDGNNRDAYFIYDTTAVNNVGSAKLRIYASLSASGTVATSAFSVVSTAWLENTIVWNNRPALGSSLGSVSLSGTTFAWYEIDVTNYVKSERAAGRYVVCLALHDAASSTVNLRINSRESTNNKPELFISPEAPVNAAPAVNAGPDQTIALPSSVTLDANAADDGLPSPPGAMTLTWSKVSGPGNVNFGTPNAIDTTASFSLSGTYVLQLQASDSVLSTTDQVQVIVNPDPGIVTLNPTADSYVRDGSANANTNFGTATPLNVRTDPTAGNNRDAYFKFDLTSVSSIANAKFRINAALSASGSVSTSVYSVATTTWIESGTGSITWNNKPARGPSPLSSVSVTSTTAAYYELDVTAYLQSEKAAGRNIVSLAVHDAANATPIINIISRESATNKPQLVITPGASTAPKIINLSPSFGLTGTVVTVSGLNFGSMAGNTIKFNNVTASPSAWNANSITVPVPAGAATGPVVVTVGGVASLGVIFTVAAADADTDADGMLDSWERMYFGGLTQTAAGDFDGDAVTNLQEFQRGRNPTKASIFDVGGAVNLKVLTPLDNLQ